MLRDAIVITDQDMGMLTRLVDATPVKGPDQEHLAALAGELDRAVVVPSDEIPPDVVTMGSRFRVEDMDTGAVEVYTLGWRSATSRRGETHVSVLAPLGTALLGYRAGDEIEWQVPGGLRRLRVVEVLSQPEASQRAESPDEDARS
jgi:regulator of nucleoside diphosphate kinase